MSCARRSLPKPRESATETIRPRVETPSKGVSTRDKGEKRGEVDVSGIRRTDVLPHPNVHGDMDDGKPSLMQEQDPVSSS